MFKELSSLAIVQRSWQGKVRDIYDLGDKLMIVTSDRISAFDFVFPTPIPDKGKILTKISTFFFRATQDKVPNHLISDKVEDLPSDFTPYHEYLAERFMLVKKTRVIPFECIVRGYITGSAWSEYKRTNTIGGMLLPDSMQESQRFANPLFTPSTKAESGHDENISYREMLQRMDQSLAEKIKDYSLDIFNYAHDRLWDEGIILADTKLEFGTIGGQVLLIDEVLTPDSSRFWAASSYEIGKTPLSFDKQYLRDYLESINWAKQPPVPELPEDVIQKTREKYIHIYQVITKDTEYKW